MEYKIIGGSFPAVVCELQENETMITEKGAMIWMSPNMEMETSAGGFKKGFGRMLSGEAAFQNFYTARNGKGMITFGSSFPGSIKVLNIDPAHPMIVQKTGFLASESGVQLSIFFQKKGSAGFLAGEGFIMQKLSGNGVAFIEIDGSVVEYYLNAGETLVVDTGNLAMCDESISIDIQTVKGIKNKLFGGEGFFNTVLTGPGRVWLQTMGVSTLADAISRYLPSSS